jgi:hypothetical protein
MLIEIVEIQEKALQGSTEPLRCKLSNGRYCYAKGKRANASGLIKEWMAANLARELNLPIPDFHIAYADKRLVDMSFDKSFGHGEIFASELIESAVEYSYQFSVEPDLQRDILLFDLWIQNEDRTLSKKTHFGNPNLLWAKDKLHVIHHNFAFDNKFNCSDFWQTHVFKEWQFELEERPQFEARLQNALLKWQQWWDAVPSDWKEENESINYAFNEHKTRERLTVEAHGKIWLKL